MMDKCVPFVCVLVLAGFLGRGMYASTSCFTGTRAVTWTLYAKIQKTWNEASQFCKERGGHLPVTNTHITAAAFQNISYTWGSLLGFTIEIWIGLHSAVSNVPNVWEANCCLLPPDVQYWSPSSGEHNSLDTQRCCRTTIPEGEWKTTHCLGSFYTVCEMDRGNCTYAALNDTTITINPYVQIADVPDVGTCWSHFLELRHKGEECVAAVLGKMTVSMTACKLYVDRSLLDENQVRTSPQSGSVVMLRRCFLANVSQETFPDFTFTNTSDSPAPANGACLDAQNTSVSTTEFLSPGMEPGLETTTATSEEAPSGTPTAAANVTPSDVTTTSAKVPKQRLCPCSCPFKRNPPRQLPASLLPVIPLNATSKKRRSKTSVKMADTNHSVVGAPWVVACVSVFCLLVLCDLNRFKERCRCKNKVDPEP